jgi:hypothetical protein
MALSTQKKVIVKHKVDGFLRNANGGITDLNRGFWKAMNNNDILADLQVVAFGNLTTDAVVADVACKVYSIYLKKQATATAAFYNVFNDATDDTTAADAKISLGLLAASDEVFWCDPKGLSMATGVVHGSYTALIGYNATTVSTTGDGPDGFIIVGPA